MEDVLQRSEMQFDQFTIALLIRRPEAPRLDEKTESALQDAHLAYLAKLHDEGYLLAAGPLLGVLDREFRGLSILKADPEKTRVLTQQDPAVQAGIFSVKVMPWIVPSGAITFSHTCFPRSAAEVP